MRSVFQAGGALPVDHPTYVARQAEHEALRAALDGDYLHIIAPRQMGKTSLLKRLSAHLGETGWRCAYVDLATLMDFPKSVWYAELGNALAHSLTPDQTPTLTNQVDLRSYLLDQALPWPGGQPCVALFLDEVEGAGKARDTDGKSFSDTFFMTLRNLYIQRDEYEGTLVVALVGAVNPSDLVRDPDISPFNVGQEISLDDFRPTESRALTEHLENLGLPVDKAIHQAIYEWTNGHPYLTQRICAELEKLAKGGSITAIAPGHVDHVVERSILNQVSPLQRDKNMRHIAKMLGGLSEPAAQLWSRLQGGETVSRRHAGDAVYLELFLTGAVKSKDDRFVIRNKIYQRAFAETDNTVSMQAVNGEARSEVRMKETVRIFISSTWVDLQPEREAVEKGLHRMQEAEFSGMEYFGSRPETPKEASLAEVDHSIVYIGLFAHRYGSGITEAEYRRARERGLPCLIYLKDDEVPIVPAHIERDPEKVAKLEALKDELKEQHIVSFFTTPDQLTAQVVTDLHNFLGRQRTSERAAPSGSTYQINIGTARGIAIGDGATVIQQGPTGEETSLVTPSQSAQAALDQRCADLAENIRETWSLIKLYEEQRRLANDPKEKRRAELEIEDLRRQLGEYEAEARRLGCEEV